MITASAPSLDAKFDPRFGRGAYFILIDTETMQWEAFSNPGVNALRGAGNQATQFVAEKKCEAVISRDKGRGSQNTVNIGCIVT